MFLAKKPVNQTLEVVLCRKAGAMGLPLSAQGLHYLWEKGSPLVKTEPLEAWQGVPFGSNLLNELSEADNTGLTVVDREVLTLKDWQEIAALLEQPNPVIAYRSHPDLLAAVRKFESTEQFAVVNVSIPAGLDTRHIRLFSEPAFEETLFVGVEYTGQYSKPD